MPCPAKQAGRFPALRHNEVRDITVSLLSEVCHGVTTEPHLQPLSGETMLHHSAITENGARPDIAMYGLGREGGGEVQFGEGIFGCEGVQPKRSINRRGSLASTA